MWSCPPTPWARSCLYETDAVASVLFLWPPCRFNYASSGDNVLCLMLGPFCVLAAAHMDLCLQFEMVCCQGLFFLCNTKARLVGWRPIRTIPCLYTPAVCSVIGFFWLLLPVTVDGKIISIATYSTTCTTLRFRLFARAQASLYLNLVAVPSP